MQWSNLNDADNGMKTVMIILFVETIVFMLVTLYLDQIVSSAGGISKHPLFFLNFKRKDKSSGAALASGRSNSRKLSGSSKSLSHMAADDKKLVKRPDVERQVSQIFLNSQIGFVFLSRQRQVRDVFFCLQIAHRTLYFVIWKRDRGNKWRSWLPIPARSTQ